MSPKPESLAVLGHTDSTKEQFYSNLPRKTLSECSDEERKKRIQLGKFLRQENPFGLISQHNFNRCYLSLAHILAFYITYKNITGLRPFLGPFLFEAFYGYIGGLGITVGCHRYWTHKTFKANRPFQYLLMVMQIIANQYSIYKWSLDHRIHHKYMDTNSDPHNATRGFWFSHMMWLFHRRHPDLKEKMETFDMPDLENDPVVRFQSKYYWWLTLLFHFILPVSFVYYMWELPLLYCFASNFRRYVISLHITWTVNSIAHIWGDKPYDKNISPVENKFVAMLAIGEGWHNYHHTFPWDYKASEFGWKLNISTAFIDFFAWLGWAYDMKTVSRKMVVERRHRTGDGSQIDAKSEVPTDDNDFDYRTYEDVSEFMKESLDEPIWGWDDEKISQDLKNITKIIRPKQIKEK